MDHFQQRQGELYAEDVPLRAIAARVGTPCYVYSLATLRRHYRVFDDAFAAVPHLICFSVKANSNLAVLHTFARLGSGFDIVSGGELFRALKAGADPRVSDKMGNTVLLQSARLCPLPVVRKLVELGAPANPGPNKQGVTPLGVALTAGKWDVAEFLVDSGARITAKEIDVASFETPTDPRVAALLKRASGPPAAAK